MARRLVIVESPAKAQTIRRHLGPGYSVLASMGHVRDLPRSRLGVDVTRGFAPEYEVPPARRRVLAELRKAVIEADEVFLAADPDREGEAICWHLQEELAGRGRAAPRFQRVTFHEITRHAIEAAFSSPRAVDPRRVDAQQTRLFLDRLVGYTVSPLLWQRVRPGLSAGRVQSVALRLVCDREREIEAFSPSEFWVVRAHLLAPESRVGRTRGAAAQPPVFVATLVERGGKKAEIHSAAEAGALRAILERASFRILAVEEKERRRAPPSAFVTSTLQQEVFRKLRFPVKKTMRIAQRLYEGVDVGEEGPVGLISYMRTDSPRVAKEAAAAAREHIARAFGPTFVPDAPPTHRSRHTAQDAHEAIRPTDVERTKERLASRLGKDEHALYALIWSRFVASQMAPAVYDEKTVDIEARTPEASRESESFLFRAKGSILRFRGFLAAYEEPPDDKPEVAGDSDPTGPLPSLERGEPLSFVRLDTGQRFTEPPPRFSEATLVRELERNGIGRPSTYASILAALDSRDYVERRESRLRPTPLGFVVTDLLVARFPDLLSVFYTAKMEEGLDAIEEGRDNLLNTLTTFWKKLETDLASARRGEPTDAPARFAEPGSGRAGEPVEGTCPECGGGLVRRTGRHGPFVGCRRYPACRYVRKKEAKAVGLACPECHEGEVVERPGPGDRTFYGCSRYPACCFTSHHRPVAESCPECGRPYLLERTTRRDGKLVFCGNEACTHHRAG